MVIIVGLNKFDLHSTTDVIYYVPGAVKVEHRKLLRSASHIWHDRCLLHSSRSLVGPVVFAGKTSYRTLLTSLAV
jgi:hypothetical protein